MSYQIEIRYSMEFVREMTNSLWVERVLWRSLWYLLVPGLALALWLISGEASNSVGNGVLTGILIGFLAACLVILWWSYRYTQQRLEKVWRFYEGTSIIYDFDDDGVKFYAPERSGTFAWSLVTGLEKKKGYWLLHFKGQQEVGFPSDAVGEEVQAFIAQKLARIS